MKTDHSTIADPRPAESEQCYRLYDLLLARAYRSPAPSGTDRASTETAFSISLNASFDTRGLVTDIR